MTTRFNEALEQAVAHHRAGRLAEAEAVYRQILAQEPEHADAIHLLGVLAQQVGQLDAACELMRRAIAIAPHEPLYLLNLGKLLSQMGRYPEAVDTLRAAASLQPAHAEIPLALGRACQAQGHLEQAIAAYQEALRLKPDMAEASNDLGVAYLAANRFDEAATAFVRALRIQPRLIEAITNLGIVNQKVGQYQKALEWHQQALTIDPNHAGTHFNLAVTHDEFGNAAGAIASYRQALQLKPDYLEAWNNLGNALKRMDDPDAAVACFHEALKIRPEFFEALRNMAGALGARGDFDQAIATHRRACALKADSAAAQSQLLYTLLFHSATDRQSMIDEHASWSRRHAEPLRSEWRAHGNGRDGERRLRVGYVSPDFREQAEAYFVVPLLEAHDHEHFEIHLYSSVERPDALTERHRKAADQWHEVGKLSDSQLAQKIRADGIDILVDLTMHMANNRALTFARKPAPVQVAWLAYPGTTGMSAMDYRITDAWMDPVGGEGEGGEGQDGGGDESVYTEKSVRLPDCWCCYHPLTDEPQINDLPASKGQSITFGALNSFHKVNEGILSLWGKAMMALPQSRLLMLAPQGSARERVTAFMSKQGIEAKRIEFTGMRPRAEYLRLYHKIDIGLDPLPYNGITTTLDALWMGVPVLSRVGTRASGRAGLAMLRALGYPDLAAQSDEAFVDKAKQLASDIPALAARRQGLRAKLQASPLMDAPRFARHMESAYRQMWRSWCASGSV